MDHDRLICLRMRVSTVYAEHTVYGLSPCGGYHIAYHVSRIAGRFTVDNSCTTVVLFYVVLSPRATLYDALQIC